MAVGDEYGLTEDLYQELIGRYVATIEVLGKRIVSKDQYIAKLETENAHLGAQVAKFLAEPPLAYAGADVYYGDTPPATEEVLMVEKGSETPVFIKRPKGKK